MLQRDVHHVKKEIFFYKGICTIKKTVTHWNTWILKRSNSEFKSKEYVFNKSL